MTRTAFTFAFREARNVLRAMLERPDRYGRVPTKGGQKHAETLWIAGCAGKNRLAYLSAAAAGAREHHALSNGALYAYKHGFYRDSRFSWQEWVHEKLSKRVAA